MDVLNELDKDGFTLMHYVINLSIKQIKILILIQIIVQAAYEGSLDIVK